MIGVRVLRDGRQMEDADLAELAALRGDPRALIWVEVATPTAEDLATLGREFGIHEIALEDLEIGERQRPKVEQYPDQDQVLLVWYGAQTGTAERPVWLWEVDIVTGQNYLITSHGGGPIDHKPFARRVKARRELASEGAGYLPYVALDEMVDTFFPALDVLSDQAQKYLQDVYDHLIRLTETIEDYQDLLAGTLDANATMASNRVNTVARNLAAYAAIFAVITMISGIYGMNFQHLPELDWRYGYGWALGLMVVSATTLWFYFKRKGWL